MQPGRARALLGRSVREHVDRAVPVSHLPGPDVDRLAEEPVGALVDVLGDP